MVVIPAMLTDAASIARARAPAAAALPRQSGAPCPVRAADRLGRRRHGAHRLRRRLAGAARRCRSSALNARYPRDAAEAGAAPRFIVLHRERAFSETEQRWIGWERKRGKLELLIAALASRARPPPSSTCGEASRIAADTRYIVTLDSDTQLAARAAARTGRRGRAPAQPAAARRRRAQRGRRLRHPAAARRHAAARAARTSRSTTGCSPGSAASTPTAPPPPRSTRTCSAKAASPARACSTCGRCMPCWPAACPKARC